MTQLLRVHNFFVSRDGFGAGEGQSLERPFGQADPVALGAWAFATDGWPNRTEPGGSRGLDDYMIRDFHRNVGAEIMGRNEFGPQRGAWEDHEWKGWWGDDELLDRYHWDRVPSPSGVTHLLFSRRYEQRHHWREVGQGAKWHRRGPPPARGV